MPAIPLHLRGHAEALAAGFDGIRAELEIDDRFPAEVLAEVEQVVARGPQPASTVDLRDVPFLTIDPPGAMDLDQALALERTAGGGFLFRYAIADVGAFVAPGGAIDAEARRRVVTVYLPDRNAPLHPPALSEGAGSLLPDAERQALVWTIRLDADAAPVDVRIERARVRSRARYTYAEAQAGVDAGNDEPFTLLREIGTLREEAERDRGGVSLPIPDQQVVLEGERYHLEFRAPLPTEGWNAQLSLLAGMCAADLMLAGEVGVLRTLPTPSDDTVRTFRRRAKALGVDWPADATYPDLIRSLDPSVGPQAALLAQAARLFRGAGYVGFDGEAPAGDARLHAAVAAPYAHVTAPLRRLVDRFGNEIALALCAGEEPPAWAREALDDLPALMAEGRRREGSANGMALDLVEAVVLGGCAGTELRGVVTNTGKGQATVQIVDPAVVASVPDEAGALEPGAEVALRVDNVDVERRRVSLAVV